MTRPARLVVEKLVPLHAHEQLRLALEEAGPRHHPLVRVGLQVRRPNGPWTLTPVFSLELPDVRRVAQALTAFADALAQEARQHGD